LRKHPKLFALLLLGNGVLSAASNPPEVKAELAGFSSERLQSLETAMQKLIDDGQLAGSVVMLARHGKVVEFKAQGKKDLSSGEPMQKDSIFRIYSMTKPITAVAMMILYEEGKWNPDDPLSKYIPEFASLKVLKGIDQDGTSILEDPAHPPTVGELMTHTAGFTYGFFGKTVVDKAYATQGVWASQSLQEMIGKLAAIPLLYQPGTRWVYSISVDIQGYLVEKLSGKSLADFMRDRIFTPLDMRDTGFSVPENKRSRFTAVYDTDEKGKLVPSNTLAGDYTHSPAMPSGGGGLVSTAADYMRFAQMLLNGGELNGTRILAPSSIRLMTGNHLAPALMTGEFGIGFQRLKPGFGYGYDVAVFTDPIQAGSPAGKGTFLWDGAAGTWFWVDPASDIVFVGMIQRMLTGKSPNLQHLSRALAFQALLAPEK
jgi:CubicO group peptidase (beta-lactamase class C family)